METVSHLRLAFNKPGRGGDGPTFPVGGWLRAGSLEDGAAALAMISSSSSLGGLSSSSSSRLSQLSISSSSETSSAWLSSQDSSSSSHCSCSFCCFWDRRSAMACLFPLGGMFLRAARSGGGG
ncbi:putative 12.4 kDa protein [Human adenovirus 41]|uniref:Uncharacterized 12.4 kDa protein in 33 kDa protein region n=2 Tax=Human adenovirus F serotype 41 TaxID=10524 RepID=YL15_ADE41|nr:RecName: Full=Uncharacterized 12.4 kDa protein in 33 kDa protein region [Human adenovirus 41]QOV03134.1 putative 12.4 kDa protein [Human adenovirus 41]CAA36766.1 unnamed protein product [Human adenovirus 41]